MPQPTDSLAASLPRRVRCLDIDARDRSAVANGIEDIYGDALDVIVVRGAFDAAALAETGQRLDTDDACDLPWFRPNEKMPVEDLQLLAQNRRAVTVLNAGA